ncbi:MAG: hypothetical protein KME05_10485 [Gloeocapsa sp. UFS-A4-WI-NPMV-4B04]|nr:hypothetical protein [Gloeocapsa sp. UFS-A4-WI-NPMV-4B04]
MYLVPAQIFVIANINGSFYSPLVNRFHRRSLIYLNLKFCISPIIRQEIHFRSF